MNSAEMSQNTDRIEDLSDERTPLLRVAALLGLTAVALGAFGAHGLEKWIGDPRRLEIWDTAVLYHLVHSVMLYIIAVAGVLRRAAWRAMAAGIVVFSGSLYLLVLTNVKWLGAITPIGGVLFLVGWGLLVFRPAR